MIDDFEIVVPIDHQKRHSSHDGRVLVAAHGGAFAHGPAGAGDRLLCRLRRGRRVLGRCLRAATRLARPDFLAISGDPCDTAHRADPARASAAEPTALAAAHPGFPALGSHFASHETGPPIARYQLRNVISESRWIVSTGNSEWHRSIIALEHASITSFASHRDRPASQAPSALDGCEAPPPARGRARRRLRPLPGGLVLGNASTPRPRRERGALLA